LEILIINENEVEKALTIEACIPVMAEALTSLARGEVFQPQRIVVTPQDAKGFMAMMPICLSGDGAVYGLKAICVFPGNPENGLDAHQGAVMLFSAETGELLAMMNASAITAIRTAAVSALATKWLAPGESGDLAIIGAGVQARAHITAIAAVRSIRHARVADCDFSRAQALVNEVRDQFAFPIQAMEDIRNAVEESDIIVTVTTATEPVIKGEWISNGTHINAVGACTPTAREIDTSTMASASLFVDRREATLTEAGDYLLAAQEGAIGPDHIRAEIGEVITGLKEGRTSAQEITLFKSLGLAVEDLATAQYIYQKARSQNIGTWLEF
jgi:ornithine cyclodeaminase